MKKQRWILMAVLLMVPLLFAGITAINLTTQVYGLLPGTNGGTGVSSTAVYPASGTVMTASDAVACGQMPILTGDVTSAGATCTTAIGSGVIANGDLASLAYIKNVFHFGCPGTGGTATWYVPLYGGATWTCASATTATGGMPVGSIGTLKNLYCKSSAAAKNGTDGAVTINRNATSGGALTCAIGTGTTCSDVTHTIAVSAATDYLVVSVTGASSETLANLNCSVELWN